MPGAPERSTIAKNDALLQGAPLSFAQERLWFLEQLDPGTAAYNTPIVADIDGPLDIGALERALSEIVRRHEALRTVFVARDGVPMQVVRSFEGLAVPETDLSHRSPADQTAEAEAIIAAVTRGPIDLAQGPLFRARVIRLTPTHHVMVGVTHHIAFDAWSNRILYRELAILYQAFVAGEASPLALPAVRFVDFARWQRDRLQGARLASELAFWKAHLGPLQPRQLPSNFTRPASSTGAGRREHAFVPETLISAIDEFSRREGATLFVSLLAAYAVLLSRVCHRERVVVGTPIANRLRPELESVVGFFLNTLPLSIDLNGVTTFRSLVQRVKGLAFSAYAHQELPFEKLVEELRPERDPGRVPILETVFVVDNTPGAVGATFNAGAITFRRRFIDSGTAKFDVSLILFSQDDGRRATLEYRRDLMAPETAVRLLTAYRAILDAIAQDPDAPIDTLVPVTIHGFGSEREAVTSRPIVDSHVRPAPLSDDVTPGRWEEPRDGCIHEWFEAQAQRTPGAVALVFEDQELTYQALNGRANQLACRLRRSGVGPEVIVGLCVERSLEMVIAVLGILKAGAAYLPLDPEYPRERLALILVDAGVQVLVTQERLLVRLPALSGHVVCLDRDATELASESSENLPPVASSDNVAYVIYTSGSTGPPKGCLITHRNVVRLFGVTEALFHFDATDVWTLFHSIAFDFSVWELWGALLYGGRLVIVPHWVARAPEAFHQLLVEQKVTVLNQTPSAFSPLITADGARGNHAKALALRYVILGGEALNVQTLRPWFDRYGDVTPQLINMYGITETTVHVTYRPLTREDLAQSASPIGRALADLEVHLFDPDGELVPTGATGEIFVGGAGVARGYLNRPEVTAARFVVRTLREHPRRLYRTGDLARRQGDGTLEFLGRLDEQVKVRGFRVELGEVEAALRQCSGVAESAVALREDRPGDQRLVGYYVPHQGLAPSQPALTRQLRDQLPEYMVPVAFLALSRLPLSQNGKLDRRALPAPEQVRPDLDARYVAPRDAVEEQLAAIWTEVLRLDRVGIHDDFFELGGHSLLATQVMARVNAGLGSDVALRLLFETPTVAGLANEIRPRKPAGAGRPDAPVEGASADVTQTERIGRLNRDAYRQDQGRD